MGTTAAGIVFRPRTAIDDLPSFLSTLFGKRARPVVVPRFATLDTRKPENVVAQQVGDVLCIFNFELVQGVVTQPSFDAVSLHRRLGSPDLFMAFQCADSGGSYGYAVVEHGIRTRSRYQWIPDDLVIADTGTPRPVESRWLAAPFFLEEDDVPLEQRERMHYLDGVEEQVSASGMTLFLQRQLLVQYFGFCSFDFDSKAPLHTFQLRPRRWWQR